MYKAYAEIWERCNKALKALIEARTDYNSTIYNDPVELLKAIKEHVLNYQESRYDMAIISDAFRAFFNCKQHKEESLQDYTKCFKVSKEILESHLGRSITIEKIIKYHTDYDEIDEVVVKRLTEGVDERLTTYVYLENSDQAKYGSVLKGLNSQKSLKNDQFPKTIIDGNNVLSNHCFDNTKDISKEFKKNSGNGRNGCEKGNKKKKEDKAVPLTFAQMKKA